MTVNPSQNMNFGYHITDEVRRRFILPLWNSYSFFATYARLDEFDPTDVSGFVPLAERTLLDRWIISRLNQVVAFTRERLEAYDPSAAANEIEHYVVEELSNWYIRRNRRRFWKSESDLDKQAAYHTLYECLVTISSVLAPFLPFVTEQIHQNLVRSVDSNAPASVHLTDFPVADTAKIDEQLSKDMAAVLEVVRLGRAARTEAGVKVRQPLPGILVYSREPETMEAVVRLKDQVTDELNIKDVAPLVDLGEVVTYSIRPNLALLGPKYGKQLGSIRTKLAEEDATSVAARVSAGESVVLRLENGTEVALEPVEILVDLKKQEGYAAAQGSLATVVLDTALTPELVQEGLARDFVRGVQDARKSAGYRIEDRIKVTFEADPEVADALHAHREYVVTETLADELSGTSTVGLSDVVSPIGVHDQNGYWQDQITVGRHQVRIALRQTNSARPA
jgi:isoleucyl-tRNA synthetase